MGCGTTKERIEDKMMIIKLERMEVQMLKEKELQKLSQIEGKIVRRRLVPDYIDPRFAKEKEIYNKKKRKESGEPKADEETSNKISVERKKEKENDKSKGCEEEDSGGKGRERENNSGSGSVGKEGNDENDEEKDERSSLINDDNKEESGNS